MVQTLDCSCVTRISGTVRVAYRHNVVTPQVLLSQGATVDMIPSETVDYTGPCT